MPMLLETKALTAFYGDFQALFGIDLSVADGETVAIIGANGAGKSTFLRALTGMRDTRGQTLRFAGHSIAGLAPERVHRMGLSMVPEGRRLFASLSVEENLLIGASGRRGGYWTLDTVLALFPALQERRHHGGAELSGGQQQMIAIGRALMSNPRLLLCDEISLGLAPKVVREIYAAIPMIRDQGTALVIIEQDIQQALKVADRVACFQEGRVTLQGAPADLSLAQIKDAYFGTETA